MDLLRVGDKNPNVIGLNNGVIIEIQNNTIVLSVHMRNITDIDKQIFNAGKPITFGLYEYGEVIFILFDFGKFSFDCPYNASLCKTQPDIRNAGNILHINVFDTLDGELLTNRTVLLPDEFLSILKRQITHQIRKPITRNMYDRTIRHAYRHNIEEMFAMASAVMVIKNDKTGTTIHLSGEF